MTREEEIINKGIEYTVSHHPVCIGGGAFADAMREFNRNAAFEAGAKWADSCPPKDTSLIKWQTGEPKENGRYLVQTNSDGLQIAIWSSFVKTWSLYNESEITAWCKLSDVEPYKESCKELL